MGKVRIFFLLILGCLYKGAHSCGSCNLPGDSVPDGYSEVFYKPSDEHLENPSRGFLELAVTKSSAHTELSVSRIQNLRKNYGITWIWREFVLDLFVESDISSDFLEKIRDDLENIREARATTVLRFLYTSTYVDEAPYGDANKTWILRHLEQLQPIFSEFEDVIDIVQAGFIGIWGEWYYSTYFGDPNYLDWSNPINIRGLTPENWQDRAEVLNAVLRAVPKSIQVQVRYPQIKQVVWGDSSPTREEEMKSLGDKARTAHHNDCFLSSLSDYGTYVDKQNEYPWLQEDTKYTAMGGETCTLRGDSPDRHKCPTATKELEELHFSFLNQAYNQKIYDEWKKDDCYPEIHRRLGYRVTLTRSLFPKQIKINGHFCFRLDFENHGYAAPLRERQVALVFRQVSSDQMLSVDLSKDLADVRTWQPGTSITINGGVNTPRDMIHGNYEVLLLIRHPLLTTYSDYNILLASVEVPEHSVGLNNLHHTIKVTEQSDSPDCNCPSLSPMDPQVPSHFSRRFCEYGGCDDSSECKPFPLVNPSFENVDEGWTKFGNKGFSYTTETASHGLQSIIIKDGGALQSISFNSGIKAFQIRADSKNSGISGYENNNYSIYCDVKLADGTWDYGITYKFPTILDDWTEGNLIYNGEQDLDEAWCYAMFRGYAAGYAYFDNFQVWTSSDTITDCHK